VKPVLSVQQGAEKEMPQNEGVRGLERERREKQLFQIVSTHQNLKKGETSRRNEGAVQSQGRCGSKLSCEKKQEQNSG